MVGQQIVNLPGNTHCKFESCSRSLADVSQWQSATLPMSLLGVRVPSSALKLCVPGVTAA